MAAFIAKRSLLASMQQLEALKNQSVLEALQGIEVKNDRPAAQTAEQANPLHEPGYPEPAMREFADLCSWIPGPDQFARACHVSRPHAKMDNCCHRLRKNSMFMKGTAFKIRTLKFLQFQRHIFVAGHRLIRANPLCSPGLSPVERVFKPARTLRNANCGL
jgi:hypothetical protein